LKSAIRTRFERDGRATCWKEGRFAVELRSFAPAYFEGAFMTQWISHLISGPEQRTWEKPDPDHTFRGRLDGTRARADEVVYEDDDVFAFRHNIDRSKPEWWEVHVVIIPKKWIPTLLDFGLGDARIWSRLLAGIQKVALKMGMYEKGFTVRMGVLPPYQHTEHVHIHILSGKHTSPVIDGPLPDAG
jgi:histidine triad (HIT) family protein